MKTMSKRKWEYPEDNPFGECTYDDKVEVYYNMTSFLTDSEVTQIWSIVGKACDRENIDTSGDQELSIRVYDDIEAPQED